MSRPTTNNTNLQPGDKIEFLGFGEPDHYWDPGENRYKPIPNQLQPGTVGIVTHVSAGQISAKWESGHKIMLVVADLYDRPIPNPDRWRLLERAAPAQADTAQSEPE